MGKKHLELVYETIRTIGPVTGYGIIKHIATETKGKTLLTVPTLYEQIKILFDDGLIERERRQINEGEERVFWKVTGKPADFVNEEDVEQVERVKRGKTPLLRPLPI